MLEFISQYSNEILIVAIALGAILCIICLVAKLFKLAIGVGILVIVVPILFTVFWGDGGEYVSKFASFFSPTYQGQIEDAYNHYKDKDAEDPFVDYDAVSNAVTGVVNDLWAAGKDWVESLPPLPEIPLPEGTNTPQEGLTNIFGDKAGAG